MNIQSSFTVYTAALHALILNYLVLAHFGLGLSWIDLDLLYFYKQSFSSPKTSSRTPYSNSKQQGKQKHSAENTINFSILAFVDPIRIVTTPSGMEIFESQVHGSLHWTPGGSRMEWRIRSPSRRGDILLGAPRMLAHFEQPK